MIGAFENNPSRIQPDRLVARLPAAGDWRPSYWRLSPFPVQRDRHCRRRRSQFLTLLQWVERNEPS